MDEFHIFFQKNYLCKPLSICKSDKKVTIGIKSNFLTHNKNGCNYAA